MAQGIGFLGAISGKRHWIPSGAMVMPAFNRLVMPEAETCPNCRQTIIRSVQFTYGQVWQHEYQTGERLRWGGPSVGEPGHRKVLKSAYPEACPLCGDIPRVRYDLLVEDDTIVSISRSALDTEFQTLGHQSFKVVET
jgi:hypothetical protein